MPAPRVVQLALLMTLALSACAGPAASQGAQAPSASNVADGAAVLRQGYDTLLDDYVQPLDPSVIALGATTGMVSALAERGVTVDSSDIPAYTSTNRQVAWNELEKSYSDIAQRYGDRESPNALAYDALRQMANSVSDCHTTFSSPQELADENSQLSGTAQFGGIGAYLLDRPGDPPVIREVFDNGPASKAGISEGDVILQVDGRDVSTLGARDVAGLIRGRAGTPVGLTLQRGSSVLRLSVVRQQVSPPIVDPRILPLDNGQLPIAYLHIYSFPSTLPSILDQLFPAFQQRNVQGWVIDLRGNGGGELQAMQDLASRFLRQGPFEQLQDRAGNVTLVQPKGTLIQHPRPLVVLVNEDSASASEMFAATVQEQGAGHVIGKRTAGCLGVARQVKLSDGSALQIKVEDVFSGIQKLPLDGNGITPDTSVDLTPTDVINQRDPQLSAAVQDILAQLAAG